MSRSVDKRHSVVNYDQIDDLYAIKDMGSLNGTFVNDTRIPEQTYMTLQQGDSIRFGYDPVTYRYDQVNPNQIRQVKDAQGITRLAAYKVEENGNNRSLQKEVVDSEDIECEEAFLDRQLSGKQHHSTEQTASTDNSHRQDKHKTGMIPSPRGSPLYGQPEWWGEPDSEPGYNSERGYRLRSGTYDATEKVEKKVALEAFKERPTKLPLGDTTRDIPVHIYTKKIVPKATTPDKPVKTPEHTEVTLVKASDRHVGFTIEFNAKEDSPKMTKRDSLQDFVPVTLKNKINQNSRIVEELKAERRNKKGDDPDSIQSPTTSPSPPQPNKSGRRRSGSNESTPSSKKSHRSTTGPGKSSHRRSSEKMDEDEDGDNVSETGTYTIESESQEVLEARSQIDEVFGINGSMDHGEERGSEEDTDKDVSDEEIVEEAITKDVLNIQYAGFSNEEHGSPPETEPYTSAYISQLAQDAGIRDETVEDSSGTTPSNSTVIKNDCSPPERESSSPLKSSPSHRQSADSIGNSSSGRRPGKTRRLLPTTPIERHEQSDSLRQNGLQTSHGSAFHNPGDGDNTCRQEEPVRDNHVTSRNGGMSYTPRRTPMAAGSQQPRPPMEPPRNSIERENSVDTEILLKDTEIFMKNLEMKMKSKSRESPSPEPDVSDARDLSHRDFDGDIDTDLESASHVSAGSAKGLYAKRGCNGVIKKTALPTKQDKKSEKSDTKGKSTIWSRLSTPNKHKRSATSDKESSVMSDNQSDSESVSFQRNTPLTTSLPMKRGNGRKTPNKDASSSSKKDSKSKESSKTGSSTKSSKPKADLSKPRQTRSTMLRKSRFGDTGTQDHSDISPTSSISDLSSSKAPVKKYGHKKSTSKSNSKSTTSRSNPVQSKVDYSRARPSLASSSKTGAVSDSGLSSQFSRHTRSQSVREGRAHAGETSNRVMTKLATSKVSSSSRRSSVSSTDGTPPTNVRKSSGSGWRKYQGESDNDVVDTYIQSVHTRKTTSSTSSYDDKKVKSSSMHNLTNHKQGQQASVQAAGQLGDEIAHVSSSLAQSLQRLTKMTQGDTEAEAALESLPKEEKVMDELFSEDAVFIPKSPSQTSANVAPQFNDSSRMQRASSLSLYPDDNLTQQLLPHQVSAGSPPIGLKHKHWGKTNESFDNLVLSSVNHLSLKLKDSSDRIAYKLKVLQCPNASEEELADVLQESEFALLKTGNKEIASILRNLRQMEKRLADIHTMIDPCNEIQLPRELSPAAQIRRKYIGEYCSSPSGPPATMSLKSPSATSPRHNWQKKTPSSGSRSVFSEGEDVEVYL